MDLDEFMQESNARARRGRAAGRLAILGVLIVLAFTAFLWLAAPNAMGQTGYDHGSMWWIVPAIGTLGIVIGLLWMVRIVRAHHEPETKGWRYRDP